VDLGDLQSWIDRTLDDSEIPFPSQVVEKGSQVRKAASRQAG
jgi:hypothetical protein